MKTKTGTSRGQPRSRPRALWPDTPTFTPVPHLYLRGGRSLSGLWREGPRGWATGSGEFWSGEFCGWPTLDSSSLHLPSPLPMPFRSSPRG